MYPSAPSASAEPIIESNGEPNAVVERTLLIERTNASRQDAAQELKLALWAGPPHVSKATAAAYSPDGVELMVATDDGAIHVWDARTFQQIRRFQLHLFPITGLSLHKTRASIVTSSRDGTVREWDVKTGAPKSTLKQLDYVPLAIEISRDEKYLAIGDGQGNLFVHSFDQGRSAWEKPRAYGSGISSIAFQPSGQAVATIGADDEKKMGILRVWSMKGILLKELTGQKEPLTAVAYDPTGQWLAAGNSAGKIEIWNASSYDSQPVVEAHREPVSRIRFTSNSRLVSASRDGSIAIRQVGSWETLHFLSGYRGYVESIALNPAETEIAECGPEVRLWDAKLGYLTRTLESSQGIVTAVVISPDGARTYSLSMDGTLKLWDLRPLALKKTTVTGYGATCLAGSSDGKLLALGMDSGEIKILSQADLTTQRGMSTENDGVTDVLFTGPSIVAAGYRSGAIRLWNVQTGARVWESCDNGSAVAGLGYLRKGLLVAGFRDGKVAVIDSSSGKSDTVFASNFGIYSIRFLSDGKKLLVGQFDGTVVVLDPALGFKETLRQRHDTYPVLRMDVSADSELVSSVDVFGTLRLMKGSDLSLIAESRDSYIEKYAVAIHPQLKLVVSGGARRQVQFWTW